MFLRLYLIKWEIIGLGRARYHRQQNKCYPQRCQILMKFDRSNKFDLGY